MLQRDVCRAGRLTVEGWLRYGCEFSCHARGAVALQSCKVDLHYYTRFIRACQTERKGLRNRQTVCGRALRRPFCKWFKKRAECGKNGYFRAVSKNSQIVKFPQPDFLHTFTPLFWFTQTDKRVSIMSGSFYLYLLSPKAWRAVCPQIRHQCECGRSSLSRLNQKGGNIEYGKKNQDHGR